MGDGGDLDSPRRGGRGPPPPARAAGAGDRLRARCRGPGGGRRGSAPDGFVLATDRSARAVARCEAGSGRDRLGAPGGAAGGSRGDRPRSRARRPSTWPSPCGSAPSTVATPRPVARPSPAWPTSSSPAASCGSTAATPSAPSPSADPSTEVVGDRVAPTTLFPTSSCQPTRTGRRSASPQRRFCRYQFVPPTEVVGGSRQPRTTVSRYHFGGWGVGRLRRGQVQPGRALAGAQWAWVPLEMRWGRRRRATGPALMSAASSTRHSLRSLATSVVRVTR